MSILEGLNPFGVNQDFFIENPDASLVFNGNDFELSGGIKTTEVLPTVQVANFEINEFLEESEVFNIPSLSEVARPVPTFEPVLIAQTVLPSEPVNENLVIFEVEHTSNVLPAAVQNISAFDALENRVSEFSQIDTGLLITGGFVFSLVAITAIIRR